MIIPKLLQKGDKVIVLSPASPPKSPDWMKGVDVLRNWGLQPILSPNHLATHFGLAGTDEQRYQDFQWALNHPEAKAIFPIRGGYGSSRFIDALDFSAFLKQPKWLVGFSDITALLMHLHTLGVASIHGPMPHNFLQSGGALALEQLHTLLFEGKGNLTCDAHHLNRSGEAEAEITGGNLSLVAHLVGTNSFPAMAGKILFLEEIGERLYHVDRMLVQLKRSGTLQNLAGLIAGGFSDCEEASLEIGKNAFELIAEHTASYHYPTAFNFPSGHIPNNQPIPFGVKSKLLVNNSEVQLTYRV